MYRLESLHLYRRKRLLNRQPNEMCVGALYIADVEKTPILLCVYIYGKQIKT